MSYLLNLVYCVVIVIASPWFLFAAVRKRKYREGWAAKWLGRAPRRTDQQLCIWLHAVSVGEANLLQTILPLLEQNYPDARCVISVTTKTAFDLARTKYAPRIVFYCPLDFSWAVHEALNRIRPDVLVLTELELWPNLIQAAKGRGVPLALINARLSERSFRGYRRIGRLIAPLLRSIDVIAAQNEEYAERFRQLGARSESIHVTGSLKFDGAWTDRDNALTRKLATLAGIKPNDVVFLAGSTQDPEESMALATFRSLMTDHPRLRMILVPRHPERFDAVAQRLTESTVCWQRRSCLERDGADPHARVLLVDTIGELGAWWGTAQIAYVGGSMGVRGGQNMIEPAAYGAAVSFGPSTDNFRDVVALLLRHRAAQLVGGLPDMQSFVRRCLEDKHFAEQLGRRAARLVRAQQGAADRTAALLDSIIAPRATNFGSRRSAA